MGLLDDAIRDHLDLKRRRGGDPTDIERAENEALGPVRRDPFEHGPDDFESASIPDDGLRAYDHEEELYDDEGYEEYGAEEEWEEEFEDQPREPHFALGEMAEAGHDESTDRASLMDHEYLEEPQPPVADESAAPRSYPSEAGAGDETMQYDVEEALASESSLATPAPEWVEQSDEWVEQSEEWIEPSHQAVEPQDDVESEESVLEGEPDEPPRSPHDPEAGHGTKAEEDGLEETPEFLEDVRDRDQLWFEQRPPRDFGFDD